MVSLTCKVIQAGTTYLCRQMDLSTRVIHLNHFIHLNDGTNAHLEWWFNFIGLCNGLYLLSTLTKQPPVATIYSDASGRWVCGATYGPYWFQLKWDTSTTRVYSAEINRFLFKCHKLSTPQHPIQNTYYASLQLMYHLITYPEL